MAMYVIVKEDTPWNVVFMSADLENVAESLIAQPDRSGLLVRFNDTGATRGLSEEDQQRLDGLLGDGPA
jgi:hypothetical protein